MFADMHGEQAAKHPFCMVMRLPDPGAGGTPPWAVIVKAGNYEGVLKGLSGKDDPKIKSLGDHDSFDGPMGQPFYAIKGLVS